MKIPALARHENGGSREYGFALAVWDVLRRDTFCSISFSPLVRSPRAIHVLRTTIAPFLFPIGLPSYPSKNIKRFLFLSSAFQRRKYFVELLLIPYSSPLWYMYPLALHWTKWMGLQPWFLRLLKQGHHRKRIKKGGEAIITSEVALLSQSRWDGSGIGRMQHPRWTFDARGEKRRILVRSEKKWYKTLENPLGWRCLRHAGSYLDGFW
jgi:hypothetical protein